MHKFFTTATILASLIATDVHAFDVVFDPTNYSENLLTAARSLEQIQNQVSQISNQVRMIEDNANMLRSIDIDTSVQLSSQLGQLNNLYSQASSIIYKTDQFTDKIARIYPDEADFLNVPDISASAEQFINDQRNLAAYSAQVHSQVLANGAQSEQQILSLIQASNAATGQTGAVQAGNQLIATLAMQLNGMTSSLAAHHQVVEAQIGNDNAQKIRTRAIIRRIGDVSFRRNTNPINVLMK